MVLGSPYTRTYQDEICKESKLKILPLIVVYLRDSSFRETPKVIENSYVVQHCGFTNS